MFELLIPDSLELVPEVILFEGGQLGLDGCRLSAKLLRLDGDLLKLLEGAIDVDGVLFQFGHRLVHQVAHASEGRRQFLENETTLTPAVYLCIRAQVMVE